MVVRRNANYTARHAAASIHVRDGPASRLVAEGIPLSIVVFVLVVLVSGQVVKVFFFGHVRAVLVLLRVEAVPCNVHRLYVAIVHECGHWRVERLGTRNRCSTGLSHASLCREEVQPPLELQQW